MRSDYFNLAELPCRKSLSNTGSAIAKSDVSIATAGFTEFGEAAMLKGMDELTLLDLRSSSV